MKDSTAFRFIILALAVIFQFSAANEASAAENRVALLIGNSHYQNAPHLATPVNDAEDVAAALASLGFDTFVKRDATAEELRRAFDEFAERAVKAEISIVYFAGYSVNVGIDSYLIPVEAQLATSAAFRTEVVPLRRATLAVAKARSLGLVMLDAFRGNPFPAKLGRQERDAIDPQSAARRQEEFRNVLMFFATEPTRISEEGDGRNSPMATALKKYLPEPDLEISFLFRNIRDEVRRTTLTKQTPYMYGQVSKERIFLNAVKQAPEQGITSAAHACDKLAAAPEEAKPAADVKGVRIEDIDVDAAQVACADAVRHFPSTDRFYFQMGRSQFAAKNYLAAIESYKKAFELGNKRALYALAAIYDNGDGIPKDPARARFYYELAAEMKFTPAIVGLAIQQERGIGGPPDSAKAYDLYQKAAELGDARAISRIGALTENGLGIKKDAKKARSLYEKAAAMGDEEGMIHLARCYANGIGGRRNIREAKRLLESAAKAGSPAAKKILADVQNAKRQ